MSWTARGGTGVSIICRNKHKCAKNRHIVEYLTAVYQITRFVSTMALTRTTSEHTNPALAHPQILRGGNLSDRGLYVTATREMHYLREDYSGRQVPLQGRHIYRHTHPSWTWTFFKLSRESSTVLSHSSSMLSSGSGFKPFPTVARPPSQNPPPSANISALCFSSQMTLILAHKWSSHVRHADFKISEHWEEGASAA